MRRQSIMPTIIKICSITIAIVSLILGPSACENCPDTPKYFSIIGLDIFNAKFTGQGLNPWKVITNESVSWKNYLMRVGFEKTYFSKTSNSVGAALFADCHTSGYKGAKIGVDTLYLITLNDYNKEFHKNDTINSIVLVNDWTYSVEDFNQFYSISTYIDQNRINIFNDVFELKISESPSADFGIYQFRLVFILSNGEIFISETDNVRLMK